MGHACLSRAFQALAWTGVGLQIILLVLYATKCALYPSKVYTELE